MPAVRVRGVRGAGVVTAEGETVVVLDWGADVVAAGVEAEGCLEEVLLVELELLLGGAFTVPTRQKLEDGPWSESSSSEVSG